MRDDRFTGFYANVITPVQFVSRFEWETTDLFLDLWLPADSDTPILLDEDELAAALKAGIVDEATAESARSEAQRLLDEFRLGVWPPAFVHEWSLPRARRQLI